MYNKTVYILHALIWSMYQRERQEQVVTRVWWSADGLFISRLLICTESSWQQWFFFLLSSLSSIVCPCPVWWLIQTIQWWMSKELTVLLQSRNVSTASKTGWTSWAGRGSGCSARPFLMIVSLLGDHFRSWETVDPRNLEVSIAHTVLLCMERGSSWRPRSFLQFWAYSPRGYSDCTTEPHSLPS